MEDLKLHDYDYLMDNHLMDDNAQEQPKIDELINEIQNHSEPENYDLNWNFYNNLHSIHPYSSRGGKSITISSAKQNAKRKHKNKAQKAARRINRK